MQGVSLQAYENSKDVMGTQGSVWSHQINRKGPMGEFHMCRLQGVWLTKLQRPMATVNNTEQNTYGADYKNPHSGSIACGAGFLLEKARGRDSTP